MNTTNRTDVQLKTGSASETVTVNDMAPALQTDRADVSAQIETKQVSDLPVGNSRNFQALESLVPGVSAPIYDHSSFFDAQNSQSFQVNGQAELANNLQLEGIDDNERTGLLQVYIPPAAAIQTVDVETSNYAPEFGRAAGAVTNVVLKSGSNQFHGSAYEYNEVSTTGARNYFNNTGKFPRFTNNYYGASDRRPDHQGPHIFLRRLPPLQQSLERVQPVHCADAGVSQRRSECEPDSDLRSGDGKCGRHGTAGSSPTIRFPRRASARWR